MEIVEEVARRRVTMALEDPGSAYPEIRDLLERRMPFDDVIEERYFNDVDEGTIRTRIVTKEFLDARSWEEIELYVFISKEQRELDIQIKSKVVTSYPTEVKWKQSLWYYAYISVYDKFLYGSVREEHEEYIDEKADELMERIRSNLEADKVGS